MVVEQKVAMLGHLELLDRIDFHDIEAAEAVAEYLPPLEDLLLEVVVAVLDKVVDRVVFVGQLVEVCPQF